MSDQSERAKNAIHLCTWHITRDYKPCRYARTGILILVMFRPRSFKIRNSKFLDRMSPFFVWPGTDLIHFGPKKVNWPHQRDSKGVVLSFSPSSERIQKKKGKN